MALAALLWMAAPADVLACPVCFAPGDSSMTRALTLGIVVLALVTVGVLGGVGAFIVCLVRRARQHAVSGSRLPGAPGLERL